ncbi:MAG: NAD(P)H-binding protein [Bacteroidota bacterium]
MKRTLAIAGASGFIGRWFIEKYHDRYNIIALSRSEVTDNKWSNVEWRVVDLYSLSSTKAALNGADYALYLVHSMSPSTRLNQSSFENTDLLLADNFARSAEEAHLKQIIFVGGILPKDENQFSKHLSSRYETELTLGSKKTPLTALRAGIIIGPDGSSFDIVKNLTERLPVMACPQWCQSPSQPIDIDDMLSAIDVSLGNEDTYHKAIEIGSEEVVSYMDILKMTSEAMNKKRWIFSIPFFTLGFSKLWVSLFSNSSITFVSPLIESLKHDMTVKDKTYDFEIDHLPVEKSIQKALEHEAPELPRRVRTLEEKNTVRSVQRLPNPSDKSTAWVADSYPKWLSSTFKYLIKAKLEDDKVYFKLFGVDLLELQFIEDRSDDNRQLFFIVGGRLAKRTDYGWLEFRSVLNNEYIICAIHEFVPRLPWVIYKYTQAVVHLWVMKGFGSFLKHQKA